MTCAIEEAANGICRLGQVIWMTFAMWKLWFRHGCNLQLAHNIIFTRLCVYLCELLSKGASHFLRFLVRSRELQSLFSELIVLI